MELGRRGHVGTLKKYLKMVEAEIPSEIYGKLG
jgi:hypothetical protein